MQGHHGFVHQGGRSNAQHRRLARQAGLEAQAHAPWVLPGVGIKHVSLQAQGSHILTGLGIQGKRHIHRAPDPDRPRQAAQSQRQRRGQTAEQHATKNSSFDSHS
ncbi:MAG: hypothetical protein EBY25_11945 [Betaproteobacteria bacterium]|nr:hypothetical protein [Betaproteobacteria bacterium]